MVVIVIREKSYDDDSSIFSFLLNPSDIQNELNSYSMSLLLSRSMPGKVDQTSYNFKLTEKTLNFGRGKGINTWKGELY